MEYERWLKNVPQGNPWQAELEALADDTTLRTDAFRCALEFGTGGLRAEIGAGSNRMNHYTVGRATQGLANYLKKTYPAEVAQGTLKAAIAYDTRRCSREFAAHAAQVLCQSGVTVYLFDEGRPTPMLSFAVRHFGCHTGIVVTASHNPKEYNGYKAYNATGGQLTDEAAAKVLAEINALDYFDGSLETERGLLGQVIALDAAFDEVYYAASEQWLPRKEFTRREGHNLKLLYSPLHGTGLVPVTQLLTRQGFLALLVVPSQKNQDDAHSFPTVKKPNPEEREAFGPAIALAQTKKPDVIFATDPDADRIGVLTQNSAGDYVVLSGTQTGALLCDYLIRTCQELNTMPPNPAVVTTIVTGTLAERICRANGVHVDLVLTGFKYIGERMDEWKASGAHSFLFGFEESFGYLTGDVCRDKDAVISSALVAEMALYYKQKGVTLFDALQALYTRYGAVHEVLHNHEARGAAGLAQIAGWMAHLRAHAADCLPGETVVAVEDYQTRTRRDLRTGEATPIALPASNVLKLFLADGSWLVLRPSGTEPKIKLYICTADAFAPGAPLSAAEARCAALLKKARALLQ
ncbi:MAG: phospho-sugar mutase [Oscillospiraceae bacterium]|nr:phospho-sugar mutase [Oscillospiraceae bacterium]